MNVLVLGGGGREHALAWRLRSSPALTELWCAPGNPGTANVCENLPVHAEDPVEVVKLALARKVELVIVGPEAPLVAGVADALRSAGVAVFGPGAGAARLEGSKAFAKEVMEAAKIPTARCRIFESAPDEAAAYAREQGRIVVKADGLAAGKGVIVAPDAESGEAAVRAVAAMGEPGKRMVLEELLEGEEVSVIALCDGDRYLLLPPAQDHKRVGDGDSGPNTGGMGAYVPAPFLDADGLREVGEAVIGPALRELNRRGLPFRGALYAGLMLTRDGLRVLEFNCRFGDPETQVLMMQLEEDPLPVLLACARGELRQTSLRLHPGATVGVVLAAEGYPASPRAGDPIQLPMQLPPEVQIFHAGTRSAGPGRGVVTSGGRVLTVCARGADLAQARDRAYAAIADVSFAGMHHRRDIGARALAAR